MGSSNSCPEPPGATEFGIKGTAHKPMLYVAGGAGALAVIINVTLIVLHLQRYRCPKEQRQIIRLAHAPVVFGLVCFWEVFDYAIAQYIDPIGDYYEAFCLCALLLLYLQFTCPGGDFHDGSMFEDVKASNEGKPANYDWPRLTWVFVFQYPITELFSILILEISTATNDYCVSSLSPKYAHIWVQIISSIGIGLAVLSILRFYKNTKSRMRVHRGLAKLVCFKLIVFLRFIQQTVFSVLLDHNVIKPNKTFSYNDLLWGLPSTLMACEMVLFTLGFWYAYSATEYGSKARPGEERMPIHKAIVDALNPYDLIAGLGYMFKLALHLQRTGGFKDWRNAAKEDKMRKKAQGGNGGGLFGAVGRQFNQSGPPPERYQEVSDAESLSRPPQSYDGRNSFQQENTSYYPMNTMPARDSYGQYPNSPPRYDERSSDHLMANQRTSRSPSPNRLQWDGQRYNRTPSPPDNSNQPPYRGRDMV